MRIAPRSLVALVGVSMTLGACSSSDGATRAASAQESPPIAHHDDDDVVDEGDRTIGPRSAASSNPPASGEAGPPAVELIGRFDERDDVGPICGWPGCRIVARFEGTRVSVSLKELSYPWMEGNPSEWDVAVDDVWQPKIVTALGTHTYPIASDLAPGPHKVELYKRSEAQDGFTQFLGFELGGGALLAPPPKSIRHIEIIGDSQPAAFGVEGVGYRNNDCPGLDYAARWQNFRKSFGSVLGNTLSAEVHGTVYSGKGVVKNIWRTDTETLPVLFFRSNPVDTTAAWDFSAWQPDVVIMMMGGNDFSIGQPNENGSNGPTTPAEFTEGYRKFVHVVRSKYPNAHLFLSVSPSVSDAEPPGRNARTNILRTTQAIAAELNDADDTKVYAFAPEEASKSELTGCNGHGTPEFHVRVAGEYASILRDKTGW